MSVRRDHSEVLSTEVSSSSPWSILRGFLSVSPPSLAVGKCNTESMMGSNIEELGFHVFGGGERCSHFFGGRRVKKKRVGRGFWGHRGVPMCFPCDFSRASISSRQYTPGRDCSFYVMMRIRQYFFSFFAGVPWGGYKCLYNVTLLVVTLLSDLLVFSTYRIRERFFVEARPRLAFGVWDACIWHWLQAYLLFISRQLRSNPS